MDLERFVTMLVSGALRFTKASIFRDDPWEGFCKVILPNTPLPEPDASGAVRLRSGEEFQAAIAHSTSKYLNATREHLYVNSWSLATDSMAMWKIYGWNGRGLAIQSSIARYKTALQFDVPSDHYTFGSVTYVNDIAASPSVVEDLTVDPLFPGPRLWQRITAKGLIKRSGYEYEREWRGALYQDPRPDITGVDITCELDNLIDTVFIGPYADEFMLQVIEDLMSRFGLAKAVSRSDLLKPPPNERSLSPCV